MKKVTIAVFAALALALTGVMPAQAEVRDDGLGAETAGETQPDSEASAEEPTETSIEESTKDTTNACDAYVNAGWCQGGVDDYDCPQIDNSHKPIQLAGADDPFGLDDDNDGEGCENDVPPPGDDGGGDTGGGGDEGGTPSEEPEPNPGDCAHYADSAAWCDDAHGDYNCPEIDDAYKPIELFDAQLDPFHLDRDADAVGCEIGEDDGGSGDSGSGDEGGSDDDGGSAGTGGDGEELPNTGGGLGLLWFAALVFVASGALLVTRRLGAQR